MTKEYDLVVLGGGTGGYVSAIRASQLGMSVAIVENKKIGGTCLHEGCIPSKALLRSAEMYRQMKSATDFGVSIENVSFDFSKALERKDNIVHTLHEGVQTLLKKARVDTYEGYGRILGSSIFSPIAGTISVEHPDSDENTMLIPKNVLIATGSKAKAIPGLTIDGVHIMNSNHALQLEKLPKSIVIIGGGIIGIEWASMLQDLDVHVTVVETRNDILTDQDHEVRKEVKKELKNRGVQFLMNATVDTNSVQIKNSYVTFSVHYEDKEETLQTEKILVSTGREPNIEQLGLNNTNINVENNAIVTNAMYQTKEDHIYAIGDCIGGMQLAHVASKEGIIAVEHMAGKNPEPMQINKVASCIYSFPEVGKVGLTEHEAKEQGFSIKIGRFPFQAIGKAHVFGQPKGFVKIIIDRKTEDILGIHMVGPQVTDMISEGSLAKVLDANAWEISQTVHPHPTLSEVFSEAALSVEGLQIHR